jgi:uncharacterized spore protein YtfJ
MSVAEILQTIGDRFESGATVKNVYGDPITCGDRTVIPVARVAYGFGGGGSSRIGSHAPEGGGGGGRMSAGPAGVVEISPAGTRFIPFTNWRNLAAIAALGFTFGCLVGARLPRSR